MFRREQLIRDLGVITAMAGVNFSLAALGYEFTRRGETMSVMWPAAGMGIAVMVGGGWRGAAIVGLGSLLHALRLFPLPSALGVMLGAVTSAGTGAWLCRRVMRANRLDWLRNQRENAAYLLAALFAPLMSIAVASAIFFGSGQLSADQLRRSLLVWWSGDALGVLLFLPLCLAIRSRYREYRQLESAVMLTESVRGLLYVGLIAVVLTAIFAGLIGGPVLLLLSLLFLMVNALWGGEWVKLSAALVAVAVILAGKYGGAGADMDQFDESLFSLQIQLGLLALTALLIVSLGRLRLLGLPSVVLMLGWGAATFVYFSLARKQEELEQAQLTQMVQRNSDFIRVRMQTYGDILRAAAAMIRVNSFVDTPAWKTYVNALQVLQQYPGVRGIGVVYPVRAANAEQFVRSCMEGGATGFNIHPVPDVTPPPTDDAGYAHFVIGLLEPAAGNDGAIGLDLASEARRQEAAMHARDTGELHATLSLPLVQDGRKRPGFLVFYPVFKNNLPLSTPAERRAAFFCWAYAPFVMEELFDAISTTKNGRVEFSVYEDPAMQPKDLLYRSSDGLASSTYRPFDRVTKLSIFQVEYHLGWRYIPNGADDLSRMPALFAAGGIVLGSALLAGLVLSLQGFAERTSRLADQRTAELKASNQQLTDSNLALSDAQRRISEKDQEARKLALLAARTVNAVLLVNSARVIEWINGAFTQMTGYSTDEAIGRTPGQLIFDGHPDPAILEEFERGMATGKGWVMEMRCWTKHRAELWISLEVQPMTDAEGRLNGHMYIATDITDRKIQQVQLERARASAEAASQAKTAFLGNISHELRTPLNVIQGNLSLVLEERFGAVNERQAVALRNARENSSHLLSLINDLLDITKAESGRIELSIERVSVRQLCADSVQMLGDSMTRKGLRFAQEFRHRTEEIGGDPLRLKQVLLNLLSNAVKFTPAGGSITLLTEETTSPPQMVFHVIDTGVGLKREDHERIFLEFEQADSLLHVGGSGTGLGLPIARRFAQLHGGSLTLTSTPGQGCCFTVRLPVRPAPAAAPVKKAATVSLPPIAMSLPAENLILAAEDYPANLELLVSFLEAEGYRVASAVNGIEAVEQAVACRPNLILMDVKMPGMDGLEATRQLKSDPRTAHIPVISLTAFASQSDAQACYDAGASGYVTKPIDFAQLSRVILRHLPAASSQPPADT